MGARRPHGAESLLAGLGRVAARRRPRRRQRLQDAHLRVRALREPAPELLRREGSERRRERQAEGRGRSRRSFADGDREVEVQARRWSARPRPRGGAQARPDPRPAGRVDPGRAARRPSHRAARGRLVDPLELAAELGAPLRGSARAPSAPALGRRLPRPLDRRSATAPFLREQPSSRDHREGGRALGDPSRGPRRRQRGAAPRPLPQEVSVPPARARARPHERLRSRGLRDGGGHRAAARAGPLSSRRDRQHRGDVRSPAALPRDRGTRRRGIGGRARSLRHAGRREEGVPIRTTCGRSVSRNASATSAGSRTRAASVT
jgi:hypothetical protein